MIKLIKAVVVNGLTAGIGASLVIGLFAFLVAGKEGVLNGVIFGGTMGFVMGILVSGYIGGVYWWTGVAGRFGEKTHQHDLEEGKE